MSPNNLRSSALVVILLLLAPAIIYGQKWEKYLDKADAQYEEGDYAKATKTLSKFKSKVSKKLGPQNEYMPQYYLREARFNLAVGILVGFENSLQQALSVSAAVNGENSAKHAMNQLEVAGILAHYGNYVSAKEYVEASEKTLNAANSMTDNLQAKVNMTRSSVLSGQGYYNEALTFINKHLDYFQSRAVTKEAYVDESGKLKTRRLSEEDVTERLGDYATMLTLKANTFRNKGNYNSADSAFTRAEEWISSNLGNESVHYVYNQFLHGQLLVENGINVDRMPNGIKFEKSLSYLKRKHEESHYLAFDLYEVLLKQYLINDNKGKYRNLKIEYEKAIKRNFGRTSLHYLNLETIEFDSKLVKDRTRNLETKASTILSSTRALPRNHKKTVAILDFLYRLELQNQNFLSAEKHLADIIEIKKALYGEDSPEYHLAKIELANYYLDYTDKIKDAEKIYQESFFDIVSKQINSWHKDYVNILNHIASFYENTDQYAKASATLEQALQAARSKYDDQDPDYGVELNQIATLQIKLGNYDQALENITKSIAILENERRNEKRVVDYVDAMETQAKLRAIQGLFDDAEIILGRSQKLLTRAGTTVTYNELEAAEELASLYITLGRYTETEKLLQKLISTYEVRYGRSSRRLVGPLVNSGRLKLISGEYPEAEKIARRSLTIAESIFGNNSSKVAPPLLLLSEVYTSIGDYEKAQENAQRAVKIQESQFGRNHVDVGNSITQLALIKFYKGDNLKDVEKLMDEAKNIIAGKLGNRNPQYANILTELSKVYISQKRYDEAFNALGLAENIWVAKVGRRNNINAAGIYTLTGDIYYLQRKYDLAEGNYEKAKKLYEKFFNNNHPEYVKILSKLSKVYYMEGDAKKSKKFIEEALTNYGNFIRDFFPALSEREKAKYWNTIKPDFEFYNTLAFNIKGTDKKIVGEVYNNALLTKAILLNSSIKIRERIQNSSDETLKSKYNEWLSKKEHLATVLSMSVEQLQENQIDPAALQHQVEQLEKELSQKSELFSSSFEDKTIVWQNVQKALKPNEVAIEMVRYRYFDHIFTDSVVYAAIYIKNEKEQGAPEAVLIKNGKDLENKYFKFYRNSIIFKVRDRYSYDNYWLPLKNIAGAYPTIYLSADGVYNQINLEAIPTNDGKYVIDDSNIILVSNTRDIYFRQVKTQLIQEEKRASMFGNPAFYLAANSGDINPLPGTEREVSELKNLLKTQGWTTSSYTEREANEEQIKRLDNPKVFHIATHGFFVPAKELQAAEEITQSEAGMAQNPLMRTGLLLTGAGDLLGKTAFNYNIESGILTAYEAMNLNLDQTELVVLSACETGLGELAVGEGVYGLQRAFLVAGAKTLIMSMFKVDDTATQKLMVKFYHKWLETGSKRQSFVDAKKEIRTEYPEPIYWGSFIMIGLE
ncbi:hypothetical protein C900_00735 [Fulvivirga imtechensis AK7]|uniref:CHAT domain-containing protein n=1 Tax=Fulvivirga imtechensis AK7 TaxID=1237149 RepID=L8JKY2_9BACT|nr:CHAT domain-containing protein [Fulvivirga imtechensis]ELR68159.1 hypothetical protein C900_00735 [Fulvivirga imtechensis AK7]